MQARTPPFQRYQDPIILYLISPVLWGTYIFCWYHAVKPQVGSTAYHRLPARHPMKWSARGERPLLGLEHNGFKACGALLLVWWSRDNEPRWKCSKEETL